MLAAALRGPSPVTRVRLNCNRDIGDRNGWAPFFSSVAQKKQLASLELAVCGLQPDDLPRLADVVRAGNLEELHMGVNRGITRPEHWTPLLQALADSGTIKRFAAMLVVQSPALVANLKASVEKLSQGNPRLELQVSVLFRNSDGCEESAGEYRPHGFSRIVSISRTVAFSSTEKESIGSSYSLRMDGDTPAWYDNGSGECFH